MNRVGFLIIGGVLTLSIAGCDGGGDDDGDGIGGSTSSAASSSGSTSAPGSTSTDSGSTTMGPVDGDGYCAQFESLDDCQGASSADVSCGWKDVTTYDGSCNEVGATSLCLWIPQPGTDPGCAPPPSCPGVAWYRESEAGVEVSYECGGSFPAGFEPCPSMALETYSIAECNCGCTLGGGSSSSGGGSSSSSG